MEILLKSIKRQADEESFHKALQAKDGEEVCVTFPAERKQTNEVSESPGKPKHISGSEMRNGRTYIVRVKKWMTEDKMDFNLSWNNGKGMPFRVMYGRVLKETRGMVYMDLRVRRLRTDYCMKCGRPLTHPVSRLYGLGPECGGHYHINPFETKEQLEEAIERIDETLGAIRWSGWIAKSGVEYASEVK